MGWVTGLDLYIQPKSNRTNQNRSKFLELFGLALDTVNIGTPSVGTISVRTS